MAAAERHSGAEIRGLFPAYHVYSDIRILWQRVRSPGFCVLSVLVMEHHSVTAGRPPPTWRGPPKQCNSREAEVVILQPDPVDIGGNRLQDNAGIRVVPGLRLI